MVLERGYCSLDLLRVFFGKDLLLNVFGWFIVEKVFGFFVFRGCFIGEGIFFWLIVIFFCFFRFLWKIWVGDFLKSFLKVLCFFFFLVGSILRFFNELVLFFCLICLVVFKIFWGVNWNLWVEVWEVIFFMDLFLGMELFGSNRCFIGFWFWEYFKCILRYFLKIVLEFLFLILFGWFFGVFGNCDMVGLLVVDVEWSSLGLLFLLLAVFGFRCCDILR